MEIHRISFMWIHEFFLLVVIVAQTDTAVGFSVVTL